MSQKSRGEKSIFKCCDCGKTFRDSYNLRKHKNKKTPCVIKEINEEDKLNPNRCVYCNKILKTRKNVNKHYKTCKIKNGGVDIICEKIRYEEELLKEVEVLRQGWQEKMKNSEQL
jgi:uncharacterized C2H2 Zn-finger protein